MNRCPRSTDGLTKNAQRNLGKFEYDANMTLSNPPSRHNLLLVLRIWKSCHSHVVPLTVHNVERRFRLDIDDAMQ